MRRFFVVAGWEFVSFLTSRRFLLSTFLSPLLFTAFILMPSFYYENNQLSQDQVIGCVELDTTSYSQQILEKLSLDAAENNRPQKILLQPILPDTTVRLYSDFQELEALKFLLDSLDENYNKIKERRNYHFQRPNSRTKTRLLSESYDAMIATREKRDLAEIEHNRLRSRLDSLVQTGVLQKADSLLRARRLSGYLLINSENFQEGIVEFHSSQPVNFLHLKPLEQALHAILVENRMREDGITVTKIQELLRPISVQEILLEGSTKRKFKFMLTYIAPIIAVLFLFVSTFTVSGFLMTSIVNEKIERVLELLVSSVNTFQLVGGKIFGIGLLGVFQILIWMLLTFILIVMNVIPATEIGFLTPTDAGIFILYYVLGYLLFAAIFVAVAALSTNREDAHKLGLIVRLLAVLPLGFIVLVLLAPASALVRFLSFIPILTPSFMVLRTPLSQPPLIDYYISVGIMALFIVFTAFFAGKIFRVASIIYHKKASMKTVMDILQNH